MRKAFFELENGSTISVDYDGDLTKVNLVSSSTGRRASGVSIRDAADRYDEQIGFNLAYYRALERLAKKNVSYFRSLADATA